MTTRILSILPCLLSLTVLQAARAELSPRPDDVEVLTRGPVHEAYAGPVDQQPRPTPVVAKPPPAAIEEQPADQRPEGESMLWIPGYWGWDDERGDYVWVSGFWRAPPPGRQWVPGHWGQAEGGWQWVSGYWHATIQEQQQYFPPPPPPVDAGPSTPAPSADDTFVPGNWVYTESRYVWRAGFWCAPRPGWVWTPAHYVWTPCGYVFVEGYWDYALRERGLLFAPVYVAPQVYVQTGWVYRPSYVVYDDCLLTSLFVRPACGHYYFGDYFGPTYARHGYVAWVNFRFGNYCPDPLFSYYRWNFRSTAGWEHDLRGLYVGRYNGTIARPPRTLVEQNRLIQNVHNTTVINNTVVNNTVVNNVNTVRNVRMVGALSQVNQTVTKLQPVTAAVRAEHVQAAQQLRQVSLQRSQAEAQLRARGTPPVHPSDAPRSVKLNLPPVTAAMKNAEAKAPPPPYRPNRSVVAPAVSPVPPRVESHPPVHPSAPVKAEVKPPAPTAPPTPLPVRPRTSPEAKPSVPMGSPLPPPPAQPRPPLRPEVKPAPVPVPPPPAAPPRTEVKPPVGRPPVPPPVRPRPREEPKQPPAPPKADVRPVVPAPRPITAVAARPLNVPAPAVAPRIVRPVQPSPRVEARPQPSRPPVPSASPTKSRGTERRDRKN